MEIRGPGFVNGCVFYFNSNAAPEYLNDHIFFEGKQVVIVTTKMKLFIAQCKRANNFQPNSSSDNPDLL